MLCHTRAGAVSQQCLLACLIMHQLKLRVTLRNVTLCHGSPLCVCFAVIQKLRCYCQMECQVAPASNKLASPPYAIHNFGWREGLSNNDDDRDKYRDGNLTAALDTKAISVTASE